MSDLPTNNEPQDSHDPPPDNSEFSINRWFNDLPIRVIGTPDYPIFYAYELAAILGIKNVRSAVSNYGPDKIITREQRTNMNIKTYRGYKNTMRRDDKIILLSAAGVIHLICSCNTPYAIELAKRMGIKNLYKANSAESSTLNTIIKVFDYEHSLQYTPRDTKYRIDLYYPTFNLAIECDENNHADYDKIKDAQRTKTINEKLDNPTWIRYDPYEKDFDITVVLSHIHKTITGYLTQ